MMEAGAGALALPRAAEAEAEAFLGYERDVNDVVLAFADQAPRAPDGLAFPSFRELWKGRTLSLIHEAKPKDMLPHDYVQSLFATALDHLGGDGQSELGSRPLTSRLGGLYCTYMLYETQQLRPKVLVYLPLALLEEVVVLVKECTAIQVHDAAAILKRLQDSSALMYGAVRRPPGGTRGSNVAVAPLMTEEDEEVLRMVQGSISKPLAGLPLARVPPGGGHVLSLAQSCLDEYVASRREVMLAAGATAASGPPPLHGEENLASGSVVEDVGEICRRFDQEKAVALRPVVQEPPRRTHAQKKHAQSQGGRGAAGVAGSAGAPAGASGGGGGAPSAKSKLSTRAIIGMTAKILALKEKGQEVTLKELLEERAAKEAALAARVAARRGAGRGGGHRADDGVRVASARSMPAIPGLGGGGSESSSDEDDDRDDDAGGAGGGAGSEGAPASGGRGGGAQAPAPSGAATGGRGRGRGQGRAGAGERAPLPPPTAREGGDEGAEAGEDAPPAAGRGRGRGRGHGASKGKGRGRGHSAEEATGADPAAPEGETLGSPGRGRGRGRGTGTGKRAAAAAPTKRGRKKAAKDPAPGEVTSPQAAHMAAMLEKDFETSDEEDEEGGAAEGVGAGHGHGQAPGAGAGAGPGGTAPPLPTPAPRRGGFDFMRARR